MQANPATLFASSFWLHWWTLEIKLPKFLISPFFNLTSPLTHNALKSEKNAVLWRYYTFCLKRLKINHYWNLFHRSGKISKTLIFSHWDDHATHTQICLLQHFSIFLTHYVLIEELISKREANNFQNFHILHKETYLKKA